MVIERSWIRFRIREEAKKMREMLKSVPYECRRSYVKYFDLKFKTIKLRTDVETFISRVGLCYSLENVI